MYGNLQTFPRPMMAPATDRMNSVLLAHLPRSLTVFGVVFRGRGLSLHRESAILLRGECWSGKSGVCLKLWIHSLGPAYFSSLTKL